MKPSNKEIKLDLIKAMHDVKTKEPNFNEDLLWSKLVDLSIIKGNNTTCIIPKGIISSYEITEALNIFGKYYPLGTEYWTSW